MVHFHAWLLQMKLHSEHYGLRSVHRVMSSLMDYLQTAANGTSINLLLFLTYFFQRIPTVLLWEN